MPRLNREGEIRVQWKDDKVEVSLEGDWNGRMLKRVPPAIMRQYKKNTLAATRAERVKTAKKEEDETNVRVAGTKRKPGRPRKDAE